MHIVPLTIAMCRLQQRRRDQGRMKKKNAKEAGKVRPLAVRDRGMGKKKLKKKEQRARLLGKGKATSDDSAMEQ